MPFSSPVAVSCPTPYATRPRLSAPPSTAPALVVNDVHAQLNATRVQEIVTPRTVIELQRAILHARAAGIPISIAGGRHSMGGQQFGEGTLLIDTRSLARVVAFDPARGTSRWRAGSSGRRSSARSSSSSEADSNRGASSRSRLAPIVSHSPARSRATRTAAG